MGGNLTHVVLFIALLLPGSAAGQVSPEEHAKHHPEDGPSSGQDAGMGGMMEGMGSMMEGMHSPQQKELYPALMELEDLPLEERSSVQTRAHERMKSGTARLANGLKRLSTAAPGDDFAEMQSALGEMREGLAEFDSGLAAHRALAEGRAPKNVALQWFKREMNLLDRAAPSDVGGPFGLSWFHFFTMTLLTGFAAVMIGMYFLKMRRATALLQSLNTRPSVSRESPSAERAVAGASAIAIPPSPAGEPTPALSPVDSKTAKLLPPSGPWTGHLRVACILTETPEIKTFRLLHPGGGPLPFRFLPGQFLTLSIAPESRPVKRSYTIASSPTVADYAEITVKREASGLVSRFLHDEVHEGDLLDVRVPVGNFTFTGDEAESIVLIGGGVGITPLMSVIRYLTDRAWPGEITLLYCCRTSADFVFRDELEYRQRRHPNLTVVATMTREAGTVWMGPKGRLTRELILGSVPDIASRRVHVCGPPAMMDALTATLRELGTPDGNVKTEAFGPAKKPAAASGASDSSQSPATAPTPDSVETATVTFAQSGKSAPLPPDTSILDVADQLGIDIENSCRVGSCGSCKVKLLEGSVDMESEDGLDPGEKEAGFILTCQATSAGSVTVDA